MNSYINITRMPVLFVGHGSPMNVIEDSPYRRAWQDLGAQFGLRWPKPKLILCISAHWITEGWWMTGMAQPKTIHDFGGFPQELFDQQYPAPGAPEWVAHTAQQLRQPNSGQPVGVDLTAWGLDHGAWGVLKPMFPAADIPVVQLSIDYQRPAAEHFALGQQLRALREQGVLILASGNTVHNLRTMNRSAPDNQAYEWAIEFDQWVAEQITSGHLEGLVDFQDQGEIAKMSHPSYDHFLPLLYAAGAAEAGEQVEFFNEGYQLASIAMRSVIWG
nr:4,5-DOPA dioxygenase extradiol [uncultured Limnohabitans sp.]